MEMQRDGGGYNWLLSLFIALCPFTCVQAQDSSSHPNLVIVIEGLRPEFVTRSTMPNVTSLARKGVSLNNHHAVFPALPIVNAVSIFTGSYPATHGMIDDSYDYSRGRVKRNPLWRTICSAVSSVSTLPGVQTPPSSLESAKERNTWAVETYLSELSNPYITVLWLGGNDGDSEVGSKDYLGTLKEIDKQIGTVIKAHKRQKLDVNIFITSSGGVLATTGDSHSVSDLLIESGLKASAGSKDVIVKEGTSIYVKDHDVGLIRRIVARLQVTEWIGAIYTEQIRVTHPEGKAKGALSFQSVYIEHKGSPDILVEPAFSDALNASGIPGTKTRIGVGETATSSPYALRIPFIANGPDIKRRVQSDVPTANSDIAPTLYFVMGIDRPDSMEGRVLHEILVGGPKPEDVKVLRRRHGAEVEREGMTYRLMMTEYTVDGVEYFAGTRTERIWKD